MGYQRWEIEWCAKSEMLSDYEYHRPTPMQLTNYFTGCGGSYNGYKPTLSWCGIFATYILRQAGIRVQWQSHIVIVSPYDLELVYSREGMDIGDVAVSNNHYFIVMEKVAYKQPVPPLAVHGNYGGVGNPQMYYGRHWGHPLSSVQCYYRILE
jgi:hypothetical protein